MQLKMAYSGSSFSADVAFNRLNLVMVLFVVPYPVMTCRLEVAVEAPIHLGALGVVGVGLRYQPPSNFWTLLWFDPVVRKWLVLLLDMNSGGKSNSIFYRSVVVHAFSQVVPGLINSLYLLTASFLCRLNTLIVPYMISHVRPRFILSARVGLCRH